MNFCRSEVFFHGVTKSRHIYFILSTLGVISFQTNIANEQKIKRLLHIAVISSKLKQEYKIIAACVCLSMFKCVYVCVFKCICVVCL